MHHHFAIVRHRITRFAPKCSAMITDCVCLQSMQNFCQLVKYSLINRPNWIQVEEFSSDSVVSVCHDGIDSVAGIDIF